MTSRRDEGVGLDALWRGLPGHPIHPPLTDVTVGTYTFAVVAATADVLGISTNAATHAWWLALVFGLLSTIVTATTGFVDWLRIPTGTPLWRTATAHMIAMLLASGVFLAAVVAGKGSFDAGNVETGAYVLTIAGFLLLTVGGWLGGSVVFVHGMRVLNLVDEPARRAAAPVATPEKREAEGA
ncbi:MAG: DUF2231 domain-containing protein [Actinobacteria bacterium]|nr:DUF2231 domain-containing protein [Actinomycetota bacterium]